MYIPICTIDYDYELNIPNLKKKIDLMHSGVIRNNFYC